VVGKRKEGKPTKRVAHRRVLRLKRAIPKSGAKRSKTSKFSIASILPILALCLSVFSLYVSQSAQTDVARIDVVKTEYGLFDQMASLQLQHPLMSHLFAVTIGQYTSARDQVRAVALTKSDSERLSLLLQERALAHFIFTIYEETYYLWQQAAGGERRRAELARDDLMFFNDFLSNNPRLLWYWDTTNGGELGSAFARELEVYYKENVVKGSPADPDPNGPFHP
jgi:hypothetical protein